MKINRCFAALLFVVAFALQSNAKECPVTGNSTDPKVQELDRKKNRSVDPTDANMDPRVTISKMLNSADNPNAFDETKAVTITGYLLKANKEKGESCNCNATDDAHHDIHVYIAPNKSVTSIGGCVVVEITPWLKTIHPEWSYEYLNSIAGHKVQITGWLLYDFKHTSMSAAFNPDNADPKRGTVWEVHPITDFVDLEEDGSDATEIKATAGPVYRSDGGSGDQPTQPKTPMQILAIIFLGAVLGVTGQLIRMALGLKKLNDTSDSKADFDAQFDVKKLVFSLIYAIVIGVVCGILMVVQNFDTEVWTKSSILAIIGAGYAGVDFIEGFVSRDLPATNSTSSGGSPGTHPATVTKPTPKTTPTKVVTGVPQQGGITQEGELTQ